MIKTRYIFSGLAMVGAMVLSIAALLGGTPVSGGGSGGGSSSGSSGAVQSSNGSGGFSNSGISIGSDNRVNLPTVGNANIVVGQFSSYDTTLSGGTLNTHSTLFGSQGGAGVTNSGLTIFGLGVEGTAHACTGIGYQVVCDGDSGFVAGINAHVYSSSIVIGANATDYAGVTGGIIIGGSSSLTNGGDTPVILGQSSHTAFVDSVIIGNSVTATDHYQMILGGPTITHAYIGPVAAATPIPFTNGKQVIGGPAKNVSQLPTCDSNSEGSLIAVKDSATTTWGATVTGGSSSHVGAYCNGTNWTVGTK